MPSPFAHITMGYVIYRVFRKRLPEISGVHLWMLPGLFLITAILSILPDSDAILGVLAGDLNRFHNNGTHSLIVGLVVAFLAAVIVHRKYCLSLWIWFTVILISYEMHIVLDFFTIGRGVMLFWPFSHQRYSSPILLFFGLHYSDGLFSVRHLWTLATEMAFFFTAYLLMVFFDRGRRALQH